MSYLLLIIAVLMWSFVGVMVKASSFMVSSGIITLSRFLFGAVFLYLLMIIMDKKAILYWKNIWIWIGVLGKCCNYFFENLAISNGNAYLNVIVFPIQTIFIAIVAIMFFNEEMYFRKGLALVLCLVGVILVGFKGEPLSGFLNAGLIPLVFFVFAAIGSGTFLVSLKKLVDTIDSVNINLTMFLFSTILMTLPLPFTAHFTGQVSLWAIVSLIGLGLVTGLSSYFNTEALKKVPFLTATLISNSAILFSLLWAWLFFKETINQYIIIGAVTLVGGIILISIPANVSVRNLVNMRLHQGNSKK